MVRIGFTAMDPANDKIGGLAALEIIDSFGQRSVLSFKQFEANPVLPANSFQFKPPPKADVIRQ